MRTLLKKIMQRIEVNGYERAAHALLKLSDEQFASYGLSRKKVEMGAKGLPWTINSNSKMGDIVQLKAVEKKNERTHSTPIAAPSIAA